MVTYTCIGQVRGSCGHRHRSERAAIRCLERDQRSCKQRRGYSDRQIIGSDGQTYEVMETSTGLALEAVQDAEGQIVDGIIAEFRGKPC